MEKTTFRVAAGRQKEAFEFTGVSNQGNSGMSLIHDYIDERKARLVRLGARPCPCCAELRGELAEKAKIIDAQSTKISVQSSSIAGYEVVIAALTCASSSALAETTARPGAEPVNDPQKKAEPTVLNIITATCRHFGSSYADIMSPRRDMAAVLPRQIVMYLAKTLLSKRSLPDIGRRIGDRDHTTVLHAVRKIKALVDSGHPIVKDINAIRDSLGVA